MLDDIEFLVMPKHPYVRSIRKGREVVVVVVVVVVVETVSWHRPSDYQRKLRQDCRYPISG